MVLISATVTDGIRPTMRDVHQIAERPGNRGEFGQQQIKRRPPTEWSRHQDHARKPHENRHPAPPTDVLMKNQGRQRDQNDWYGKQDDRALAQHHEGKCGHEGERTSALKHAARQHDAITERAEVFQPAHTPGNDEYDGKGNGVTEYHHFAGRKARTRELGEGVAGREHDAGDDHQRDAAQVLAGEQKRLGCVADSLVHAAARGHAAPATVKGVRCASALGMILRLGFHWTRRPRRQAGEICAHPDAAQLRIGRAQFGVNFRADLDVGRSGHISRRDGAAARVHAGNIIGRVARIDAVGRRRLDRR
jgi:hypothetical protein